MEIGFVLLAAGNAVRFGENKLLCEFHGRALIDRALDAIPADCPTAVVSQYPVILEKARGRGFLAILNEHPEEGISRSIRLGLEALRHCDALAFAVADQPLLRRETLERQLAHFRASPQEILALASGGVRGNPCIFPHKYFEDLANLHGDIGGSAVIRQHPQALRLLEVPARELADADSPQALAALEEL